MPGKILIVDDVATNRIVLKVKLASAFYETIQAQGGSEALALAREHRPDLILLDLELPDIGGVEVCRELKADPLTRDIPIVVITAFRDPARKIAALTAGAEEVFWKPIDELVLLARLRSLARARQTAAQLGLREGVYRDLGFAEAASAFEHDAVVGVVARRLDTALGLKRELAPYLHHRVQVFDRDGALNVAAAAGVPDVFVVAPDFVGTGEGLRLMSELRSRPATRHSAVCVMLPPKAAETAAIALDLGANDLIEAGAEPEEMALRISTQIARKRQSDRLRASVADGLKAAVTDPLTGLHNRRYADTHLLRIADRARTTGRGYAVMVADLDRFKSVNDAWGHAAGDAVLVEVAARLRANLRPADLVARIGGEEFLIALPDTDLDAARTTAERLRQAVGEAPVRLPSGAQVPVTLSIGIAVSAGGAGAARAEDVLHLADTALMAAKSEGRNQVTVGRTAA